jgi:hypothetical protein
VVLEGPDVLESMGGAQDVFPLHLRGSFSFEPFFVLGPRLKMKSQLLQPQKMLPPPVLAVDRMLGSKS